LVGGDLVLGEAGFVFSAHNDKVSDIAQRLLQGALD
jgi:hypothetical protein